MEFGVKVTEVSARRDDFFEMRLHTGKVWFIEKDAMATAVHCSFGAFEIFAFPVERFAIVSQLKQPPFFKDNFHPFKPPRHGWMVICEVEQLDGPIRQHRISHFWTTWTWSPTQLRIFHHLASTGASGACFGCNVALSNRNKALLKPWVLSSNISMLSSTWLTRSSLSK